MSKEITRINVGARMSEAAVFNGVAYLSGQVGNPKGSVTEQTRDCLAEVDRIWRPLALTRPASCQRKSGWPI